MASQEHNGTSVDWVKMLAATAAAGTFTSGLINDNKTDCCGIAGVIGTNEHDARCV